MNFLKDINIHLENKKASRSFFVFIWILYALVYMTKNCFSGALSSIVAEGSLTLTEASIINGAFYAAYAPLQILGGIFADKYSPEKLITVGLVGSAVANAVIFFNQSFWVILSVWIFNAIIQFALWPAVYKVISSQLVRSDRSEMIFFISFSSSGGLVMTYVVSAIIPHWKYNFAISSLILLALVIILLVFCRYLNPMIKCDALPKEPAVQKTEADSKCPYGAWKLFLLSGFLTMVPAEFFRQIVKGGTNNLSSAMLFQSYEQISPAVGNLLNTLIIIAGIAGTVLLRMFVFPKLIKNELIATILLLLITLPFAVILRFVGIVNYVWIVIALSAVSFFISPMYMLIQQYILHFAKYGMTGKASGIMNAAASTGLVVQFFVLGPLADRFGWVVVTVSWIVMTVLALIFTAFTLRTFRRFASQEN